MLQKYNWTHTYCYRRWYKTKKEIESYNKSWGTMYRQTIHAAQIIMHWLWTNLWLCIIPWY